MTLRGVYIGIILLWFWQRCSSRRYGASEATDEEAGDNRRSSEHSLNASKSVGRCHEAVEAIEGPDDEADGALYGGRTCSERQVVITRRYLLQNKSAKLCLHFFCKVTAGSAFHQWPLGNPQKVWPRAINLALERSTLTSFADIVCWEGSTL